MRHLLGGNGERAACRAATLVGATALMALLAGEASAQNAQDFFVRDRNISVRERPRVGYEPLGVRTGAFMAYPRVTTNIEANDNIYAAPEGAREGDAILSVRPEVSLRSGWSRHHLGGFARANVNRFAETSRQNNEEYGVGVDGRLDVLRGTYLYAGTDIQKLTESRIAPTSSFDLARPNEFGLFRANVGGVRQFNRTRFSGRLDYSSTRYEDNVLRSGVPVNQEDRDYSMVTGTARAEYATSPAFAVYVAGSVNDRNYRLARSFSGFSRDSSGQVLTVGAGFDLTRLTRGEIEVGYMRQKFADPRFSKFSGVTVNGSIEFFPTQLTTVTLRGGRSVQETNVGSAVAFITSNVGLQVDHELRRWIILGAGLNYNRDKYESLPNLPQRRDNRFSANATATYLMNRRTAFTLTVDRNTLSSNVAPRAEYAVNRAVLSMVLQL